MVAGDNKVILLQAAKHLCWGNFIILTISLLPLLNISAAIQGRKQGTIQNPNRAPIVFSL
jgi:hypothetical protein